MSLTARGSRGKSIQVFFLYLDRIFQAKGKVKRQEDGVINNSWVTSFFLLEHSDMVVHVTTVAARQLKEFTLLVDVSL